MTLKVAVPKENAAGERRVAADPGVAERLAELKLEVLVQKGAGEAAGMPDEQYTDKGASIVAGGKALLSKADLVLKVQPPTEEEIGQLREGTVIIGMMMPHLHPEVVTKMRDGKITSFGIELIPRISRAQSMDALSSQASVAGYKAAIMGSDLCPRFFPMLTTAAGTIRPAKVVVIGAGVAGLQAIATARRLGAQVEAYDVRAATKEQVKSLGAKFIEVEKLKGEGEGGYARELTDEEKAKQQEVLAQHIARADVVISTAAIPGRPSPKIISKNMVAGMKAGGVIIDLAAEGGGNCALTDPGKTVQSGAIIIHGPLNVPSQVPFHASEMYARNLLNFLSPMIGEGQFKPDWEDQIIVESVLTHDGEIRHAPTRKLVDEKNQ